MNLAAIRTEVLNHGFDPIAFSPARLNQYINDGQNLIARRVDYYVDEKTLIYATAAGNDTYALMAGGGLAGGAGTEFEVGTTVPPLARVKSVFDSDRNVELQQVSERQMDASSQTQGAPQFYAIVGGGNLRLYPIPDGVYNLKLRGWWMPAQLVNDTDVPSLPEDWHSILWVYAVAECYAAEDDPQTAQYWAGRFKEDLAEFTADQKFPSTDWPSQAASMWGDDQQLGSRGWSLSPGW